MEEKENKKKQRKRKSAADPPFKPTSDVKGLPFGGQFIVKSFPVRRAALLELLCLLSIPPPPFNQSHSPNQIPFPSTIAFLPITCKADKRISRPLGPNRRKYGRRNVVAADGGLLLTATYQIWSWGVRERGTWGLGREGNGCRSGSRWGRRAAAVVGRRGQTKLLGDETTDGPDLTRFGSGGDDSDDEDGEDALLLDADRRGGRRGEDALLRDDLDGLCGAGRAG